MNNITAISVVPTQPARRAWIAAFAALLLLLNPLAHAGPAELKLLNDYLNLQNGTSLADAVSVADTTELVNAVITVIAANPAKNAGTIAGEALKRAGINAADFGSELGLAIVASYPGGTIPFGKKTLTLAAFATQTIKTSASSTGANVTQVPGFASQFVDSDAAAIALAASVKSSKTAAGAVLQGRALELTLDSDKQALANTALADKTLAAALQEVAAGVAATVTDVVAFTNAVVTPTNLTNTKNVLKIIPGIVAGQPGSASAIVEAAFSAYPQATTSPVIKGAAALAKSVGAIADIEEIGRVGISIANRVGTGIIKYSQINGIVTTLAKAIVAKPLAVLGENRNANKVDELGELAAYVFNAVINNTDFRKAPEKNLAALIKAIVTGSKSAYGPSQLDVTNYVVGSIALTIANLSDVVLKTALTAYLQNPATAKALGGAALVPVVNQAIAEGLTGTTDRFENGTDPAGSLADPETNSRNL